jgi:hypothetical protein
MTVSAPDYVPRWGDVGEERARMRTLSLGVPCESCGAGIGVICTNYVTGLPLSWRLPAHTARLIAVGYGNH